jgi:hypothetical protein
MTAETILYIILSLLRADNANNLDNQEVHNHLVEVAESIEAHATPTVPAERLISLAYNESRFGYKYVLKGTYPKSSWNACGIYQQVPKFSRIETTCEKLGTDVDHATEVAVAYLDYMIDRWEIKGSSRMDKRMCHYYSGNKCDAEAHAYAKRHRKVRLKALKLRSKASRASTPTKTPRRVRKARRVVTKADLFSGLTPRKKTRQEMTHKEWIYALHNEQDESRRAELGLPPNKL